MPQPKAGTSSSSHPQWRPTKIMNMRDLSRDDDFLSHLLVEKLGTGAVPLIVHKMDANRTIPKADPDDLIRIVRRLVTSRGPAQTAIREAVDELLTLDAVRYYLKSYDQKQINAFSTHASRYFELYLPSGSIEIAHTSRYSHKTGKSELCILATRPLMPGMVVSELKGSMADLTEEEDLELKRIGEGTDGVAIRRDFSVIHSKQLKKNHLFLGPARFVNHDCDHNVELFREGRYITFRVIKPIGVGEEVTAHYGDGYFGRKNRHCLCETCEKNGRGGYALHSSEDELSDSAGGSPQEARNGRRASVSSESESEHEEVDVNERRTRRGVYAVVKESEKGKEKEIPSQSGIELEAEVEPDVASELTSLGSSGASLPDPLSGDAGAGPSKGNGLMTPDPEPAPLTEWLASTASAEIPREDDVIPPSTPLLAAASISAASTPASTPSRFRSVISTRSQKAREEESASEPPESISASVGRGRGRGRGRGGGRTASGRGGRPHVEDNRQLRTPPLTSDSSTSVSVRSSSRIRNSAGERDTDHSRLPTPLKEKADGTTSASASTAGDRKGREDEPHSETRTLRPRQFHLGALEVQAKAKAPAEGPRGVDGKLLPTCVTCHNVLPVIHVEGKPVWGLALGRTGKRGRPRKNVNVECPRCMRHYEIYNLKWPERLPGDGSTAFLPTPRDTRNSTPITSASLAALDRKLKFATHGYAIPKRQYIKRKLTDAEEDPRPAKKPKPAAPTGTGKPRGRPPKKNKVGMSANAQLILKVKSGAAPPNPKAATKDKGRETEKAVEEESSRRSGRTRMPSLKLRESETPNTSRLPSRSRSRVARPVTPPPSSSTLSGSDNEGRPELPQTPVKQRPDGADVESPKVPTPKSLAVAAQPRESNGRFGRKNLKKTMTFSVGRKNRTKRVLKGNFRTKVVPSGGSDGSEWESADEGSHSPIHEVIDVTGDAQMASVEGLVPLKRSAHDMLEEEEEEEPSLKKIRMEEEEDEYSVDDSDDDQEPVFFRSSLITGAKPGVGLLRAPNPVTFARRKWATARADQVSRAPSRGHTTDEETDLPVTPEIDGEPEPAVTYRQESDSAEEDVEPPPIVAPAPFVGKLTIKPSPINLSRRRWAPPPPRPRVETKADDSSEEQPSENQRVADAHTEGYWSDEDEWGWPWTESEDDGEEESPSVVHPVPHDTVARRVHAKDTSSSHPSPTSERTVGTVVTGSSSSSSVHPTFKPLLGRPAMNWKRTMFRDGMASSYAPRP
ncbi:hypothetical protein DAEQUDRAFT_813025 [Daedalea quercina L-15889]|uniref:SET domain-containing protein n=1 Tax=Daedalea quercina L-15889 TaxID=1314783 RepID=A0A165NMN4_9APHY|nr:hypothetical protein DAEQUDRAFT_813025 [Daedalea quercina L-15889]